MTHKFAEYLQSEFPDWNVDCEYNRCGDVPKRLQLMVAAIPSDDEDDQTVFPDIIVHHRGQPENLLVIEAKRSGNKSDTDRKKLAAFKSDERYRYDFAVILRFNTDEPLDIVIERC